MISCVTTLLQEHQFCHGFSSIGLASIASSQIGDMKYRYPPVEVVISRLAVLTYTVRWYTPSNRLNDQFMFDSSRVISTYTCVPGCITFPLIPINISSLQKHN